MSMRRWFVYVIVVVICGISVSIYSIQGSQSIKGQGNVQNKGNNNTINNHVQKLKAQSPEFHGSTGNITIHNTINNTNNPTQSSPILKPVRSELVVPETQLERQELVQELERRFNQTQQAIVTVALVGIGGSGKTTLARLYGRGKKYPVVWEINAEVPKNINKKTDVCSFSQNFFRKLKYFFIWQSKAQINTNISNSFSRLAAALAQTSQQKEELATINQNQDIEEREKQRVDFVKARLKERERWLLIFDNVDSYETIKKYLPNDSTVWGNGEVIITTQDDNVRMVETIKSENIIKIGELTLDEAIELFTRIRSHGKTHKLSKRDKELSEFLESLPPFPLDIFVAASHIANNPQSYTEYLRQIRDQGEKFNEDQQEFLNAIGNYTKTRYSIITLSLEQVMRANRNFAVYYY